MIQPLLPFLWTWQNLKGKGGLPLARLTQYQRGGGHALNFGFITCNYIFAGQELK